MTLIALPMDGPDVRVAAAAALADDLMRYARQQLVKAHAPIAKAERDAHIATVLPDVTASLAAYFLGLADRLLPVAKADDGPRWDPDAFDWRTEEDLLASVLREWAEVLAAAGYDEAMDGLGLSLRLDVGVSVPEWITEHVATAVKGITLTTRAEIQSLVTVAVERGYSIANLVRGVEADGFAGLRALVEGWATSRATTIALTETATVWNKGTIEGYRASGLVDQVTVLDGVIDAVCAAANGATWTLEEALANPTGHPRCQRAFAAVVAR